MQSQPEPYRTAKELLRAGIPPECVLCGEPYDGRHPDEEPLCDRHRAALDEAIHQTIRGLCAYLDELTEEALADRRLDTAAED